jgi:thiazolylpeptide-type bacteriocin precursor
MSMSPVKAPESEMMEFDGLELEELAVFDISDAVALPEMGASHGHTACCSSSSSSSSCCCC